jgi:type II secretory pathway component GspD/PulD (secretin)
LPKQLSEQLEVTVCVPDRGILMIGGLTSYGKDEVERGVPILNKIPILKRLFMGEAMKINQSTLIILVRPRIILLPEEEGQAF